MYNLDETIEVLGNRDVITIGLGNEYNHSRFIVTLVPSLRPKLLLIVLVCMLNPRSSCNNWREELSSREVYYYIYDSQ